MALPANTLTPAPLAGVAKTLSDAAKPLVTAAFILQGDLTDQDD